MDAMDAATKAKFQKYLDAQLFTESALESAYDNGYFNGEKKGEKRGELKTLIRGVNELASMGMAHQEIAKVFGITLDEVQLILEQKD